MPEEFRAPVLFLLSEGSSYVTGSVSRFSDRERDPGTNESLLGFEGRWWTLRMVESD